jgi:hypothetical protein
MPVKSPNAAAKTPATKLGVICNLYDCFDPAGPHMLQCPSTVKDCDIHSQTMQTIKCSTMYIMSLFKPISLLLFGNRSYLNDLIAHKAFYVTALNPNPDKE